MSGSVRKDIERSFAQPQPDVEIGDVLKSGAALGGGILAGRKFGKWLLQKGAKRSLQNDAMKVINRTRDTGRLVPPDSGSRFRKRAPTL